MLSETIEQVFADLKCRFDKTLSEAGMVKVGEVRDVAAGRVTNAFLYVQAGGDRMEPIHHCNSRGDVWVGRAPFTVWFCCCPDTPVYGTVAR